MNTDLEDLLLKRRISCELDHDARFQRESGNGLKTGHHSVVRCRHREGSCSCMQQRVSCMNLPDDEEQHNLKELSEVRVRQFHVC